MKKLFFTGFICLFLTVAFYPQYQSDYKDGLNSISSQEIKQNITFLASDSLKGRFTGSNENLVAAMFIANKFKEYGLKEILPQRIKYHKVGEEKVGFPDIIKIEDHNIYKGYLQNFTVESSRLSDDISLSITTSSDQAIIDNKFLYGTDFLIQNKTVKDEDITAPLVFAGFGIQNGENGYNDQIGRAHV